MMRVVEKVRIQADFMMPLAPLRELIPLSTQPTPWHEGIEAKRYDGQPPSPRRLRTSSSLFRLFARLFVHDG